MPNERLRLTKICSRCGLRKPKRCFYSSVWSDGFTAACKECLTKENGARTKYRRRGFLETGVMRPAVKKCSKCKLIKSGLDFHISRHHPDGLRPDCVQCVNESKRSIQARAAERRRRAACLIRDPIRYKVMIMVISARKRAKQKGLPFDINNDYILNIAPLLCPVLKMSLDYNASKLTSNSPTLDRFYPELGYIKGNVFVISHKANTIKQNASYEDLQNVANWVRVTENNLMAYGHMSGIRRNSSQEAAVSRQPSAPTAR